MGSNQSYPVSTDFDANGTDDVLFVNPVGPSTMRRFTQAGHVDTGISLPRGYTVRAGDVDGDWQGDLLLYRRLASYGDVQTWFTNNNGTTFRKTTYRAGSANYQPVMADISGDFKADVIFYQPGSAPDAFWRGFSPSSPYWARESASLGLNGNWVPVAGDWDGTGTDDLFLFGPGAAADQIWRSNLTAWLPQNT
jgi:hypothetical protein